MRSTDYNDEDFGEGVRSVISRFSIKEAWCPECRTEVNFVKLQDCANTWRCLGCLGLFDREFVKLEATTLRERDRARLAEEHRDYEKERQENLG